MTQRFDYNAVSPDAMKALGGVHGYIGKSGLPQELVNLVYLRISLINGCAYCIDMHTRDLLKAGVKPEKVALVPVWHEGGALFDDRERAALAWSESVTRVADTYVPDEVFTLARAHFSEKELADLTVAIGLINVYNRMAISFRTVPTGAKG